jgi:hypothetical protein
MSRDVGAREVFEPVVKRRRKKQSRNHADNDAQLALATALYLQAIASPRPISPLHHRRNRYLSGYRLPESIVHLVAIRIP